MLKLLTFIFILVFAFLMGYGQQVPAGLKFEDAPLVLNIGTFHMGYTSDASKAEFDNRDPANVKKVHDIAKLIAEFRPTIIVVETTAKQQRAVDSLYKAYLTNPNMKFDQPSEVELLAYEVGRLSNTNKIVGIDHKMDYQYANIVPFSERVDKDTHVKYEQLFGENILRYFQSLGRPLDLLDTIIGINQPLYLDYLTNVNADLLTYVSTQGNAEGADQAAKYYHRNLIMFSNLNQIKATKEDRIFILLGASHTAFFHDFLRRSPKYKVVNTFEYLKK